MSQRPSAEADDLNSENVPKEKVVDFNQAREQRLEEKRRKTERVFFKNFISVYSVVDKSKMHPVELIDVSEEGCSFQVPYNLKKPIPWPQQSSDLPLRMYFSQDSFLEIIVHIKNSSPIYENETSYVRFGCAVDKSLTSYPAYQQFVRFLKLYAEHCRKDNGEMSVFFPS